MCGKTVEYDLVGSTLYVQKHEESDRKLTETAWIFKEWLEMMEDISCRFWKKSKSSPTFLDQFVFTVFGQPRKVLKKPDSLRRELHFPPQTIIRKSAETFAEQLYHDGLISPMERSLFARSQKHSLEEAGQTYVNKYVVKTRLGWSWNRPKNALPQRLSEQATLTTKININYGDVVLAEELWARIIPVCVRLYNHDGYLGGDVVVKDKDAVQRAKLEVSNRLRRAKIVIPHNAVDIL